MRKMGRGVISMESKKYHGHSKGDFREACHKKARLFRMADFGPMGKFNNSPVEDLAIKLALDGIDDVTVLLDVMIDHPNGKYDDFLLNDYLMGDYPVKYWLNY